MLTNTEVSYSLVTAPDEIEGPDADERLLSEFVRARRRFRGAIVAISDRTMITNAAASELLQPADRRLLCSWMQSSGHGPNASIAFFELGNGITVRARCHPVTSGDRVVGVVLHLSVAGSSEPADADEIPPVATAVLDAALLTGWSELTDSERTVAELVGRGLSNRESGRRLFISRHTVDYHLRRVYRKLGITSRVELARLLGEHYESLSYSA
jgi:DNA-binding CsgD family transcriptional regulator